MTDTPTNLLNMLRDPSLLETRAFVGGNGWMQMMARASMCATPRAAM